MLKMSIEPPRKLVVIKNTKTKFYTNKSLMLLPTFRRNCPSLLQRRVRRVVPFKQRKHFSEHHHPAAEQVRSRKDRVEPGH